MRIISLLPSATEIVCLLGLGEELVGVTHECDYPAGVKRLPKLTRSAIAHSASSNEIDQAVAGQLATDTSLYHLNEPLLRELAPDLIITQGLCDVCAVSQDDVHAAISRLPRPAALINLEPTTLNEMLASIEQVGRATDTLQRAHLRVAELRGRIEKIATASRKIETKTRVVLLEWIDPPFSAGHWDAELVELAGGAECLGKAGAPSRRLEWSEIAAARPDVIFIACCGFDLERTLRDLPILAQYPGFSDLPAAQSGWIYVCDGSQYFSRPGPRLVDSLEILAHALHPETHPLPPGLEAALRWDATVAGAGGR